MKKKEQPPAKKPAKTKKSFPATLMVHWPTGPVPTCDNHAAGLLNIARLLGTHVTYNKLESPAECTNCKNEANSNENKS